MISSVKNLLRSSVAMPGRPSLFGVTMGTWAARMSATRFNSGAYSSGAGAPLATPSRWAGVAAPRWRTSRSPPLVSSRTSSARGSDREELCDALREDSRLFVRNPMPSLLNHQRTHVDGQLSQGVPDLKPASKSLGASDGEHRHRESAFLRQPLIVRAVLGQRPVVLEAGGQGPRLLIRPKVFSDVLFFFQAEDGIRDIGVTGVQTCALPI